MGSGNAISSRLLTPVSPTACRALVDELEWEIAQVDPRKTIQMGSFRINPDGSQSVVEVRRLPVGTYLPAAPGGRVEAAAERGWPDRGQQLRVEDWGS